MLSHDQVHVKGAGRGRERDETDGTFRDVLFVIEAPRAVGPAFVEINVNSRYVVDAK